MKWLTRLKSEKGLPSELPEPPKASYDSFDSGKERYSPEIVVPLPEPFFDESGDIVIPFNSDPRYHWWVAGGQSIEETVKEITGKKERA